MLTKALLTAGILLFSTPSVVTVSTTTNTSPLPSEVSSCGHNTPLGVPLSSDKSKTFAAICHQGYLSHYDEKAKIPDWVVYSMTPMDSMGCANRSNAFKRDPTLSANLQSSPDDYVGAGYDKGHIANDQDMRWDSEVERESFYMTNMTPQKPSFNRGIWKNLEDTVRSWSVTRTHNLTIYAGPIYNIQSDKKIGKDNVDVPTGFYKIIVDDDSNEAITFQFDNQDTANSDSLESHRTSIDSVEKATGITFPVPKQVDKASISPMWEFQAGLYNKEKKAACSK